MTDIRKAVARAIAKSVLHQDDIYDDLLPDDLKLAYLDQGEVDFGLVADAAIAAHIEAIMEPTTAMARAGLEAMQQDGSATQIWQAILTAMRNEK